MRDRKRLAEREDGGCILAGPGRGDCSHFIGLPGENIPGQHDGPDTEDVYGKPNGWCWSCWKSQMIAEKTARVLEVEKHEERIEFLSDLLALGEFELRNDEDGTIHLHCEPADANGFGASGDTLYELLDTLFDNILSRGFDTPEHHEKALARLTALMDLDPAEGTPEFRRLVRFGEVIEAYEEEHFPIPRPTASTDEREEQT